MIILKHGKRNMERHLLDVTCCSHNPVSAPQLPSSISEAASEAANQGCEIWKKNILVFPDSWMRNQALDLFLSGPTESLVFSSEFSSNHQNCMESAESLVLWHPWVPERKEGSSSLDLCLWEDLVVSRVYCGCWKFESVTESSLFLRLMDNIYLPRRELETFKEHTFKKLSLKIALAFTSNSWIG